MEVSKYFISFILVGLLYSCMNTSKVTVDDYNDSSANDGQSINNSPEIVEEVPLDPPEIMIGE